MPRMPLDDLQSELEKLGEPRAVYKTGIDNRLFGYGFALVLVIIGLAAFFFSVALVNENIQTNQNAIILLIIAAGVAIAGGIYAFKRTKRRSHLRIFIFDDAMAQVERDRLVVFRWDEIKAVWQNNTQRNVYEMPAGTTIVYSLQRRDGEKLFVEYDISQVKQLGSTIQQETFRRLFPRAVEAYDAGEMINFEPFSVCQDGLGHGKRILPWEEVKAVKIWEENVRIEKKGGWLTWASVPVAAVPNCAVFLALVENILASKQKSE